MAYEQEIMGYAQRRGFDRDEAEDILAVFLSQASQGKDPGLLLSLVTDGGSAEDIMERLEGGDNVEYEPAPGGPENYILREREPTDFAYAPQRPWQTGGTFVQAKGGKDAKTIARNALYQSKTPVEAAVDYAVGDLEKVIRHLIPSIGAESLKGLGDRMGVQWQDVIRYNVKQKQKKQKKLSKRAQEAMDGATRDQLLRCAASFRKGASLPKISGPARAGLMALLIFDAFRSNAAMELSRERALAAVKRVGGAKFRNAGLADMNVANELLEKATGRKVSLEETTHAFCNLQLPADVRGRTEQILRYLTGPRGVQPNVTNDMTAAAIYIASAGRGGRVGKTMEELVVACGLPSVQKVSALVKRYKKHLPKRF